MSMRRLIALLIGFGLAGACAPAPDPSRVITLGDPVDFVHSAGVFALRVPGQWRFLEDRAETEAFATFTDPNGWASLTAYTGLLAWRFAESEGLDVAAGLAENLLGRPEDFEVIERQRLPDGGFEVTFEFLRDNYRRKGRAVFYDRDLALAGTIVTGTQADWEAVYGALKPYADTFKVNPDAVQGTYFLPLVGAYYGLAVPADWSQRPYGGSMAVRSRSQSASILVVEEDSGQALDDADALINQAIRGLRRMGVVAQPLNHQPLSDGRLKVILDGGERSLIGYLERFDTVAVGLFFDVPADRVADYQPFMDFVYSTYISGLP